jgi:protein-S-isoprenylcysteine O-methyltransferase Ste14
MRQLSLRQGVVLQVGVFGLVYAVAPMVLARRDRRRRRARDGTAGVNPIGLVPVGAGAALIVWSAAEHYRAAGGGWRVEGKRLGQPPDYLLTTGPYAFTRNPVHLGGSAMLLGWSVVLRSRRAATMWAVFAAGMAVLVPAWEERELEAAFGDEYRRYEAEVPRWV